MSALSFGQKIVPFEGKRQIVVWGPEPHPLKAFDARHLPALAWNYFESGWAPAGAVSAVFSAGAAAICTSGGGLGSPMTA